MEDLTAIEYQVVLWGLIELKENFIKQKRERK